MTAQPGDKVSIPSCSHYRAGRIVVQPDRIGYLGMIFGQNATAVVFYEDGSGSGTYPLSWITKIGP